MAVDLIRSWLLAAAVYLGLNYLLVFAVGHRGPVDWLYILCPLVAGIAASAYHAEFGTGGWLRHMVAVFTIPVLFELYARLVRHFPQSAEELGALAVAVGLSVTAGAFGLGIVMLTRLMVMTRGQREKLAVTK